MFDGKAVEQLTVSKKIKTVNYGVYFKSKSGSIKFVEAGKKSKPSGQYSVYSLRSHVFSFQINRISI
jgi:hypothetical protein